MSDGVLAQSASGLRQLKLLVALKELIDERGIIEAWSKDIIERAAETDLDGVGFAQDAELMKANGWVDFEESLVGVDSLRIKQYGRDVVAKFIESRDSAWERQR